MKATARPMTLYFDMKSMNSAHMPFGAGGAGGAGLGSNNARIFFSSSNISSSLTKTSPSKHNLQLTAYKLYKQPNGTVNPCRNFQNQPAKATSNVGRAGFDQA